MKNIALILSTYNGSAFLSEFLDSLLNQSYQNFILYVRDDGSVDKTCEILIEYKEKFGERLVLLMEDNVGVILSYSHLLQYAHTLNKHEYYMFADQDDVWSLNKIEVTLGEMITFEKKYGAEMPLLVHSDLFVTDMHLNIIYKSFMKFNNLNPTLNTLNRLMVQNIITGCTVMMNEKLVMKLLPIPNDVIMHDWWVALIASTYGKIEYIDKKLIYYRQHNNNTIGVKRKTFKLIINKIRTNDLTKLVVQSNKLLMRDDLPREVRTVIQEFSKLFDRNNSVLTRIKILFFFKFLKHGLLRNVFFVLKIIYGSK